MWPNVGLLFGEFWHNSHPLKWLFQPSICTYLLLRAQKIYLWYCCTITLVIKNYIICYYKAIFRWCVTMFITYVCHMCLSHVFVTCVRHMCSSHMFVTNLFVHTYTKNRPKLKTVSKLWRTHSQTLGTLPTELQKVTDNARHTNIILHYYGKTSYISTTWYYK